MDLDNIQSDEDMVQWLYEALRTHPNVEGDLNMEYIAADNYLSDYPMVLLELPNGLKFEVIVSQRA